MKHREHRHDPRHPPQAASRRDSSLGAARVAPGKRTLTTGLALRAPGGGAPPQRQRHGDGAAHDVGVTGAKGAMRPPSTAGVPMPGAVQAKMERAFGADFSAVRIHQGDHVTALRALAYAQGTDIHFAPGQYAPGSQAGDALLGHELAHVVQQAEGRVQGTTQAKGLTLHEDGALEREADAMGTLAARGQPVGRPAPAVIQARSAMQPVQRFGTQGESAQEEAQLQEQVLLQASGGARDYTKAAVELEQKAIDVASQLASLIDEERHTDSRVELMDIKARLQALMNEFSTVVARAHEISDAIVEIRKEHAHEAEDDTETAQRSLVQIGEIQGDVEPAATQLLRDVSAHIHRDRLRDLEQPSSWMERQIVAAESGQRQDDVSDEDVREINNWVAGSAGPMNKYLQGREDASARAARRFVAENAPDEENRWKNDIEARIQGLGATLEKLPNRPGVTYRKAGFANIDVFRTKIKPDDFILSKGFWATSMIKGGEGAAGGASWGSAKDTVYFEVVGTSGRDLGPYQQNLKGEREVLYPRDSVFQVEAISIKANTTAFVLVKEVLALPADAVVKDPHTGEAIPATKAVELA